MKALDAIEYFKAELVEKGITIQRISVGWPLWRGLSQELPGPEHLRMSAFKLEDATVQPMVDVDYLVFHGRLGKHKVAVTIDNPELNA